MRSYSVAVSAFAIGSSQKWLDNVLSHFSVPDVVSEKRGVARRIPHSALLHLALAHELHTELAVSVREALKLASQLLADAAGVVTAGGHVRVTCDRAAVERELFGRLHDALEFAPAPRRGRPARRPAIRDE